VTTGFFHQAAAAAAAVLHISAVLARYGDPLACGLAQVYDLKYFIK
jgi:hypothetical protein